MTGDKPFDGITCVEHDVKPNADNFVMAGKPKWSEGQPVPEEFCGVLSDVRINGAWPNELAKLELWHDRLILSINCGEGDDIDIFDLIRAIKQQKPSLWEALKDA